MSPKATGALLLVVAIVDWFTRETIKTVFFDRVVHTMSPNADALIEYGPPLAFAAVGLYLLWRSNVPKSQRTKRYMISVIIMTAGCVMLAVGAFMYRAETGHFPLLAQGEAGKPPSADQPRQERQEIGRVSDAKNNLQAGPQQPETTQPSPQTKSEVPPKQNYYTRSEIDVMLSKLGELQRQFKVMPRLTEAVQKLIARRTGIFQTPPFSEFLSIAEGLDQYAQQLEGGLKGIENTLADADEFVRSAPQGPARDAVQPFALVSRGTAESLRTIGSSGANERVAAMALNSPRQYFFDSFMRYSAWLSSSETRIAERIADLRGRDVR
jgi:hypothetical protein